MRIVYRFLFVLALLLVTPSLVAASASVDANLLSEGERRQVIQFNPSAALQKQVFADGFVPNSPEYRLQAGRLVVTAQRAEHLATGRVRAYYVRGDDWGAVQFVERTGAPLESQGEVLLQGERRQVIQFNPHAALQKRIFADGFVPNSPEFRLQVNGVGYAAQRAEHLRTGQVRVYYARVGDWNTVRYVQRGAGAIEPSLSIAPTSGPADSVIRIEASGLPANTPVQVLSGPAEGGHADVIARGRTDAEGRFVTRASLSPIKGNRLGIRIVALTEPYPQAYAEFAITRLSPAPGLKYLFPTSRPGGLTVVASQSYGDETGWRVRLTNAQGAMGADILGGAAAQTAFDRYVRPGAPGRLVSIGGHPGLLYSVEGAFLLTWLDDDQRYVIVSPRDEDDLITLAEGLLALDLAQFKARLARGW